MKVYKVTLMILDHDELGLEEIKTVIQEENFPNDCIAPSVMDIESAEIGEWEDSNLLNHRDTKKQEFDRLFSK